MTLIIVISIGDFQLCWNVLSLSFSERESGKWPLGLSDFYHTYLICDDCIGYSGKLAICNTLSRKTVLLVSYIKNSLRFWYHASFSTCCQNLERKIGITGKIWEKAGIKLLRDLTEKSIIFSTSATSNIRLLLVFGEEDQ